MDDKAEKQRAKTNRVFCFELNERTLRSSAKANHCIQSRFIRIDVILPMHRKITDISAQSICQFYVQLMGTFVIVDEATVILCFQSKQYTFVFCFYFESCMICHFYSHDHPDQQTPFSNYIHFQKKGFDLLILYVVRLIALTSFV